MGTSVFAFIIVLGILIFVHEFGHFIVARLCGVGVEKFSLGFGPRVLGKTVGITDYRLSAIPLGGYVKMVGDEPGSDIDPEIEHLAFINKPLWQRSLIVAAGPVFNLLLAVVIFLGIFLISGIPVIEPSVGQVAEDSPAQAAGLEPGDIIATIEGTPVESWEQMAALIGSSDGQTLTITIQRGHDLHTVNITPEIRVNKNIFGEDIQRHVIGVTASGASFTKELNIFEALKTSFIQTYNIMYLTVVSVVKMIQGTVSAKNIGGPIMIAEMAGQQAQAGAGSFVFFIALLSINLAILNFLPIPVLDGGHLLFFLIEAVIRRPVNIRVREIAQQTGVFILVMLMILVFYNDITRIISG